MHLPCKQAETGALPADSTISLRGEWDSGEPHNLSLRGCDSHPRYQSGEVFRLPVCKTGVANNCRK